MLKNKNFFNKTFSTIFAARNQNVFPVEKNTGLGKLLTETNCMKNPAYCGFFLLSMFPVIFVKEKFYQ
jgi:hypothetical protein